jgi:hypothetical protein
VLGLGEGKEEIFGGGLGFGGILGTRTIIGLPIGSFYGYVVEGVFQNAEELNSLPKRGGEKVGDLRFADLDGDGVITDEGDRTFIGNPIPDFIYGFNAGAEFGGFDFSIEFNGQSGNDLINAKKMARFGNYNYEVSYLVEPKFNLPVNAGSINKMGSTLTGIGCESLLNDVKSTQENLADTDQLKNFWFIPNDGWTKNLLYSPVAFTGDVVKS